MFAEREKKNLIYKGKIVQMDGESATLELANGEKIFLPKKLLPPDCPVDIEISFGIGPQNFEDGKGGKDLLNHIIKNE